MQIEQFVMAYGVEQDRLRAILPDGYTSLRPVLRINAEVQNGDNVADFTIAFAFPSHLMLYASVIPSSFNCLNAMDVSAA